MSLIIDEVGKRTKADWINNFTILAALIQSVAAKIDSDKLGAANGVATLNASSKVVQTALNSEKIGGLTLAEFVADYTEYTDDAIAAVNAVIAALGISDILGLSAALDAKQDDITPDSGWSANTGATEKANLNAADWNEATGSKNVEDLAKYVNGIVTALKLKGIFID